MRDNCEPKRKEALLNLLQLGQRRLPSSLQLGRGQPRHHLRAGGVSSASLLLAAWSRSGWTERQKHCSFDHGN